MTDATPFDAYADAALARATGSLDVWTTAYVTEGGTWILASSPAVTDSGRPHDLVAVLPAAIETSRVIPLRPTVNPDLVDALRAALDGAALAEASAP